MIYEGKYMILETERLYLREMNQDDLEDLSEILQDKSVMYAYEHAFSNDEVQQWLDRQIRRYKENGFGLWAIISKTNGEFIGQAGLTIQDADGLEVLEIGYLLKKKHWHQGYAAEAAIGCKIYAFNELNQDEVYSIIRENNYSSQQVAIRNGMIIVGAFTKYYYHQAMPHLIFSVRKI